MKVITRMDAASLGLLKYYTGKPCAKGHDSPRYTRTGLCVACSKAKVDARRKLIKDTLEKAGAGK